MNDFANDPELANFEYTRAAAFEGGTLFAMQGDTLLMGHFENTKRPAGVAVGYHAALCRLNPATGLYEVEASGNRYYESEWSQGGPADVLAKQDIADFNVWLAGEYGGDTGPGDAPPSLFTDFVGDMHDVFRRHQVVDGQLVEVV